MFFSTMFKNISYSLMDAERLLELFQTKPSISDLPSSKPLKFENGLVKFDRVEFAYDERKPTLKNVSFTVPSGKTVALVGQTGGGKSTILKLIDRFYDVKSGSISIDGQDIRDVSLCRYVLQPLGYSWLTKILASEKISVLCLKTLLSFVTPLWTTYATLAYLPPMKKYMKLVKLPQFMIRLCLFLMATIPRSGIWECRCPLMFSWYIANVKSASFLGVRSNVLQSLVQSSNNPKSFFWTKLLALSIPKQSILFKKGSKLSAVVVQLSSSRKYWPLFLVGNILILPGIACQRSWRRTTFLL